MAKEIVNILDDQPASSLSMSCTPENLKIYPRYSYSMDFDFKKGSNLQKLYENCATKQHYEQAVVKAFFKVMTIIASANDIRDIYNIKSLCFEKLKGDRQGQRAIRLNDQWRLIVSLEKDEIGDYLLIHEIVDYHP